MKVPVVYAPDEMMKIMKQTQKQQICNYDTHYTFLLDVGLGHILGEYLSEGAAREWSTVAKIFLLLLPLLDLFHCLCHDLFYLKHPNKSFLTQ